MNNQFFIVLFAFSYFCSNALASPTETVLKYYKFLSSGECEAARSLRPGAGKKICSLKRIDSLDAMTLKENGTTAIVKLDVAYTKDGDTGVEFSGYVLLKRNLKGNWKILNDDFYSKEREAYSRHASLLNTSKNTKPSIGSSHPLNDYCWKQSELQHFPGEEVPQRLKKPKIVQGPSKTTPIGVASPLPPSLWGSIRSVDVGQKKLVALTFDIGEQNNDFAGYDGRVIDVLRQYGVSSTLYLGGKWMLTHPKRTYQLISDPLFEIGNHAWTHGNFRLLSKTEREEQIDFTQAQYEDFADELRSTSCFKRAAKSKAIPIKIDPFIRTFRFPYGTCTQASFDELAIRGMPAIQWDVVSADAWRAQTADNMVRTVLQRTKPGSIVLMHANGRGWKTHKAIEPIILGLLKRGYQFVTVSELLTMGKPIVVDECYENKPGDNLRYNKIFGKGTWRGKKTIN